MADVDPYAKQKAAYEERLVAIKRCQAKMAKVKGVSSSCMNTQWHHAFGVDTKNKLIDAELKLMRNEE